MWSSFRGQLYILEYCVIQYAGKYVTNFATYYRGAVNLGSASPTISPTLILSNSTYAISMDTGSFLTVLGNTFAENGANGLGVYGGTISTAGAWMSTNYPYVMDSDITIAPGVSLTIAPDVIVKSKSNTRLIVDSVLNARGTLENPIVFTSYKDDSYGEDTNVDGAASTPAPGDWGWIEFTDASLAALCPFSKHLKVHFSRDF